MAPRTKALQKARRKSKLADKRVKWEYKCNHCNKWFKNKDIQVDHIIPKGRYSQETFFIWLDRLFVKLMVFRYCVFHAIRRNQQKSIRQENTNERNNA